MLFKTVNYVTKSTVTTANSVNVSTLFQVQSMLNVTSMHPGNHCNTFQPLVYCTVT